MILATIKASQRNATVTILGLDIAWHTMTGGGVSSTISEDPTDPMGPPMVGEPRAENIVLTTSFSPRSDLDWIKKMKAGVGTERVTVVRQWTDENRRPLGEPEIYPDCLLIGYENPVTAPTPDDVEFSIVLHTTGEAP